MLSGLAFKRRVRPKLISDSYRLRSAIKRTVCAFDITSDCSVQGVNSERAVVVGNQCFTPWYYKVPFRQRAKKKDI